MGSRRTRKKKPEGAKKDQEQKGEIHVGGMGGRGSEWWGEGRRVCRLQLEERVWSRGEHEGR